MNLVDLGAKVSDGPLTYIQAMQVFQPACRLNFRLLNRRAGIGRAGVRAHGQQSLQRSRRLRKRYRPSLSLSRVDRNLNAFVADRVHRP